MPNMETIKIMGINGLSINKRPIRGISINKPKKGLQSLTTKTFKGWESKLQEKENKEARLRGSSS